MGLTVSRRNLVTRGMEEGRRLDLRKRKTIFSKSTILFESSMLDTQDRDVTLLLISFNLNNSMKFMSSLTKVVSNESVSCLPLTPLHCVVPTRNRVPKVQI